MYDTRVFHDFSKKFVLKDFTVKEDVYANVVRVRSFVIHTWVTCSLICFDLPVQRQKLSPCDPATFSDSFKVAEKMPVRYHVVEKCDLSSS